MAPPDGVAAGTDKANSKLTTTEPLRQLTEVCVNCFITPLNFWYHTVTDFAHDNPAQHRTSYHRSWHRLLSTVFRNGQGPCL